MYESAIRFIFRSLSDPNVTRIRKGAIWDASEKIISCLFPIPYKTELSILPIYSIWYWWQNLVSKIESILVCNYYVLENHWKKPHGHIKNTKSCVDWIIFLLPKYASVVVFSLKTMVATSPGWSCWCTEDAINVQAVTILPFFHNFFCPHSDNNLPFRRGDVAVMGSGSESWIQVTFS